MLFRKCQYAELMLADKRVVTPNPEIYVVSSGL